MKSQSKSTPSLRRPPDPREVVQEAPPDTLLHDLAALIDEAGLTMTFSANCRTGLVGGLCRCWRCAGVDPDDEDPVAARDAEAADRAYKAGIGIGMARGQDYRSSPSASKELTKTGQPAAQRRPTPAASR